MLKCDQPERPKKVYIIPKQSKKRLKEIYEGTYKPKQQKPIKPRSDKRAKQEREYLNKTRPEVLKQYSVCQARIKCIGAPATECHHMIGRIEHRLNDKANIITLCHDCHVFCEMNPEQAKALNISNNRL